MPRCYAITDWHKTFAASLAAGVKLESLPTQARGALLAADNDEPEIKPLPGVRAIRQGPGCAKNWLLTLRDGSRHVVDAYGPIDIAARYAHLDIPDHRLLACDDAEAAGYDATDVEHDWERQSGDSWCCVHCGAWASVDGDSLRVRS